MAPYRDFFKIVQNPELQNGELKLPEKFVKMYWKNMPNPIFLKLPNGSHKWEIFWVERAGKIWFQKEWENFAKLLEYGYLLMFKYLGGSNFEVKILDCSTVEIDYSKIKCVEEEEDNRSKDEKSGEECIEISETEAEGATEDRRIKASKRKSKNVDFNAKQKEISAAKKAKKCSNTEEAVKERAENSHSIDDHYPSFQISMGRSYIENSYMLMPMHFSREHMKGWEGKAIIRAAHDMSTSWEMSIKNSINDERSQLGSGWKKFAQNYNLQVNDICKFVMTQKRDPMSFTVTIPQVRVRQNLQDSQDRNDVVKVNTFKITITTTKYLHIPCKFMKRHSRCQGTVKLKFGETSWLVNLTYYENVDAGRFYRGWPNFVKGCNLKIGDTCLFELIDEENQVFNVTQVN